MSILARVKETSLLEMRKTIEQLSLNAFDGVNGLLAVGSGGTGLTSYAIGDLLYASAATTLAKLPDVATGNALISGGVTTAPSWGKIGLTTHVTGTLAVANGGTGLATLTAHSLQVGNGTSNITQLAVGGAGQILAGAASADPAWTATPTLGASGTLGTVTFGNATSGTILLTPAAGALGTKTLTMPATTGTIITSGDSATVTAAMLVNSGVHTGDAVGTFPTVTLNAAQSGITTAPNVLQKRFNVYLNGAQNNQAGNTLVKVLLDSVTSDPSNYLDTTNHRWTPLESGTYFFYGQVEFTAVAAGYACEAALYKNGVAIAYGVELVQGALGLGVSNVCCTATFNGTTDYIELWAYQSTPALGVFNLGTGATLTFLCGFKVSA